MSFRQVIYTLGFAAILIPGLGFAVAGSGQIASAKSYETLYQKKLRDQEHAARQSAKSLTYRDIERLYAVQKKEAFERTIESDVTDAPKVQNKERVSAALPEIQPVEPAAEVRRSAEKKTIKPRTSVISHHVQEHVPDVSDMSQHRYVIGSGDQLKITVFGEPDLSGSYTVNEAGEISFPLVGELDVRNSRLLDVKEVLVRKLADGYLKDPDVSIEVTEFRPFYIMGEVNHSGSYMYVAGMNILNAVALAGGFTYRADQDDAEVKRQVGENVTVFDDIPMETKVLPGDIIVIHERFF